VIGRAANGLAAIVLADVLGPDAIVIDLHMPLVDGVTAVARLRKDHPSVLPDRPDRRSGTRAAPGGAAKRGRTPSCSRATSCDALIDRLTAVRAGAHT